MNPQRVGFLEESAGVRSVTRLLAAVAMAATCLLAVGAIVVALRGAEAAAGIIAALAGFAAPLMGGMWGALRERTGGESPPDPPSGG